MPIHATWAEPVLLTAEDLLAMPEDGWRYELIEGRLVRVVEVWSAGRPPTPVEEDGTLAGEDGLAGFTISVADLFAS